MYMAAWFSSGRHEGAGLASLRLTAVVFGANAVNNFLRFREFIMLRGLLSVVEAGSAVKCPATTKITRGCREHSTSAGRGGVVFFEMRCKFVNAVVRTIYRRLLHQRRAN